MVLPNLSRLVDLVSPGWKYIGAGVGLALLSLIIVLSFRSCDKRHDDANANLVNQGAVIERSETQSETINAVEVAKQATTAPTTDQLNRVCARYDRNCH